MVLQGLRTHNECYGYHIGLRNAGPADGGLQYVEMHVSNQPFDTPAGKSVMYTSTMRRIVEARGYFAAYQPRPSARVKLSLMDVVMGRTRHARIMREQRKLKRAILARNAPHDKPKGIVKSIKKVIQKWTQKAKESRRSRREREVKNGERGNNTWKPKIQEQKARTDEEKRGKNNQHPEEYGATSTSRKGEKKRCKVNAWQKFFSECTERITRGDARTHERNTSRDARNNHENQCNQSCIAIRMRLAGIRNTGRRKPYKRKLGVLRFTTHPV